MQEVNVYVTVLIVGNKQFGKRKVTIQGTSGIDELEMYENLKLLFPAWIDVEYTETNQWGYKVIFKGIESVYIVRHDSDYSKIDAYGKELNSDNLK